MKRHEGGLRPPNWRWQTRDHELRPRPDLVDHEDGRIGPIPRVAVHAPGAMLRRQNQDQRDAINIARSIWESDDDGVTVKAQLEALVLTGMPPAEIAARLDLSVLVVRAFEWAFFDVRPRLQAMGYVLSWVIGDPFQVPFSEHEPGRLLKRFAYSHGLGVYERALEYLLNRDRFSAWIDEAADDDERLERHLARVMVRGQCISGLDENEGSRIVVLNSLINSKWSLEIELLPPVPGFALPDTRQGYLAEEEPVSDPEPAVYAFDDYAAAQVGPPYPAA